LRHVTEPAVDPQPEAQAVSSGDGERACPTCGSAMASEQDWCLACGQATPGLLGGRPGRRAVGAVAALTILLCGGAVAASYAALSKDDPATPATAPLVAQAPAALSPAPADGAAPAAPAPAATTAPAADTTAQPPAAPAGASNTPSTIVPSATPSTGSSAVPRGSGPTTSTTTTTTTTTTASTTTATAPDPVPIALKGAQLSLYDPYAKVLTPGTPARALPAIDPSKQDTKFWKSVVKTVQGEVGVGLVIDLGTARGVRVAQLTTTTPGFRTEIYAADSDELPPNVLDTRWAHLKDQSNVGVKDGADGTGKGDGEQRIVLGRGSTPYRYVLLWITDPPTADATLVSPATPPQAVTNADGTVSTVTAATISISALQLLG
jgi:hypothetical protein